MGFEWAPEIGVPHQVAEGVYWLRMPLPLKLDHINLWLLDDGDAWTIVDTSMNMPDSREIWERVDKEFFNGKPVNRVICTHMHPDHVGLAGWLCERFSADLWMSRTEYLMCKNLTSYTGSEPPEAGIRFYVRSGFDEEYINHYRSVFGQFGKVISPLPHSFRRMIDGETFEIGGRYWQALATTGHSPEHISLYCPALKLLISGDQILPRITPNVGVFPNEPDGDSLKEWLESLNRLRHILPDNLLVLPSHQSPFYGVRTRLTQLVESHEEGLDRLYKLLEKPQRVIDCFPALFKSEITRSTMNNEPPRIAQFTVINGRKMPSAV